MPRNDGSLLPHVAVLCTGIVLTAACAPPYVATDRGPQAYYQTGFPVHDTSRELERILRSIKRIHVTGFYTTWQFAAEDSITIPDLRIPTTYARAVDRFTFDHSKAGTATIVSRNAAGVTLITNEHVTRLPDTIVVHYRQRTGGAAPPRPTPWIESVSIRTSQRNLVADIADAHLFTVVARDSANDVAAIRVSLPGADQRPEVQPLRLAIGDPARLAWGSFVYVVGYPRGHRMVTRAVVSDPGRPPDDAFMLDGLFNPGISGGLILAVRGDTGALEWVGMAAAASATSEYMLMPSRGSVEEYGILVPYEGGLHLERISRIDYGITFSVPSTAVRRFMARAGIPLSF